MRGLLFAGWIAAGLVVFGASSAAAGSVEISAECHWHSGVECQASCDSLDFGVYCEGEVDVECAPYCDELSLDAGCQVDCQASCEASCELDPPSFDCEAYCGGECGASCAGECEASENQASCEGECEAYCEGECGASCEYEPGEADCQAQCEGGCEGECWAEAKIDCHICDIDVSVDCEAHADIDCQAECDVSGGVLECNGEFLGGFDLDAAVDWVRDNTNFDITYEGEASCTGNTCEAHGSCALTCAVGAPARSASPLAALAVLAGAAALALLRRR